MADFETECRRQAQEIVRNAFVKLGVAFNLTDIPHVQWRYSAEVREQFLKLIREVSCLIRDGDIEANPAHAQYLAVQDARNDPALQALIRRASKKTPIRARLKPQ